MAAAVVSRDWTRAQQQRASAPALAPLPAFPDPGTVDTLLDAAPAGYLSGVDSLRLLEAGTTGYNELASAAALGGEEVWGPMALSDGKLVLRDLTKMICLDVRG